MSDEEDSNVSEEQQEEDESQENDEQDEQEDEDEDEQDQQQDEDDDDDQQNSDQDQDESGSGSGDQEEETQGKREELPRFRQPQEFRFTSLLSEISSLSSNVDRLIDSFPSHGGLHYRSYTPAPRPPPMPPAPVVLPEESRVVVMKDEDVQVAMQPQIVIQPTKVKEPAPEPSYKISNQSSKFLAQLYQENKKLKRWQNSQTQGASNSGFYNSRQRFERQQHEKGLFNVDERNREIDHAIEMLRRQEDD